MRRRRNDGMCSKCGGVRDRAPERYCRECKNLYARTTRTRHRDLPEQERKKANARSYANVYLKRGLISRGPCEVEGCGGLPQMHHDDYSKPTKVRWLCQNHHIKHHRLTGG